MKGKHEVNYHSANCPIYRRNGGCRHEWICDLLHESELHPRRHKWYHRLWKVVRRWCDVVCVAVLSRKDKWKTPMGAEVEGYKFTDTSFYYLPSNGFRAGKVTKIKKCSSGFDPNSLPRTWGQLKRRKNKMQNRKGKVT